jgi:phosphate-selective porin
MIKRGLIAGTVSIIFCMVSTNIIAQRYLTDIDSSFFIKDTVRPLIKRFENLIISGYMQPQFQVAESDGAPSYAGGAFSPYSKSRFMLRRARVKTDYLIKSKRKYPQAFFSFQIDATERGVIVRDMYVRLFESKHNNISVATGLFARPFGFEVNLSSNTRETPERGRMSQILMPGERDLGVAVTFESLENNHKLKNFKFDAGFFNGQGVVGTTDFDSYKDFISRLVLKPQKINNSELGAGLSLLRGGMRNGSKYVFEMGTRANGSKAFLLDSSETNLGASSPRHYYGGDVQYKINHKWGATELRAEYWFGTQPGTSTSTANPGTLPTSTNGLPLPTYIRHFDGAFFYFLQNIVNPKHQLLVKYDWYDPNIKVSGMEIGVPGANLTAADIKFSTLGLGYVYYFHTQIKLIFYYDIVKNEETQLPGYTSDLKDNIFTLRLQFRF